VIQSWIQTIHQPADFAAHNEMRLDRSLSAGLCVSFDNTKYQPSLGGFDRPEAQKI
jgi:hypothetical protein